MLVQFHTHAANLLKMMRQKILERMRYHWKRGEYETSYKIALKYNKYLTKEDNGKIFIAMGCKLLDGKIKENIL